MPAPGRITRRAEFRAVYDRGARIPGRLMTVFILPNNLPMSRLGVSATRKLGGAVVRNRAKRLIREAFRLNDAGPGLDIVVVPRRELPAASYSAVEDEYRAALSRRRAAGGRKAIQRRVDR